MDDSVQSPEINTFSLAVLRDRLLPDLLQEDEANILYWAGKGLATRESLTSITTIEVYFNRAGFGNLKALAHKGSEIEWILSGPVVLARLTERDEPNFYLEAGFLAQVIETLANVGTETTLKIEDEEVHFTTLCEQAIDLPI
ncbi:DUF2507 domain-containing protein [Weissella minor]|uniref:DUF2507 domain-containing protein n=1 Tax=Weissella minor TaxID=1620 RepID=A0A0R2JIC1_9LACO|nr:DUF2507 domain-containing protein [Weissella minor]KRN77043.1 hypothetical protein IV67_GL000556 [Weissella minor]